MKYLTLAFFTVWSLSAFADPPKSVEIRFCPASAVRTYPLESRRDLQSLLLQNAAVINHGQSAFRCERDRIGVVGGRARFETQKNSIHRPSSELLIAARNCRQQASFKQVGFQFCGNDLIAPNIKIGRTKVGSRSSTAHRIAGFRIQRRARYAPGSRARQPRRPYHGIHRFNPNQIRICTK